KPRQRIARRVYAAPERPVVARWACRAGRRAIVAIGDVSAVCPGRRALMAAAASQQTRGIEVGLRRDERARHARQQTITDIADACVAPRAAQPVIGAERHRLVYDDSGCCICLSHVVHGAYLSPWLRHAPEAVNHLAGIDFVGGSAP